jgi:hypothetical protein
MKHYRGIYSALKPAQMAKKSEVSKKTKKKGGKK